MSLGSVAFRCFCRRSLDLIKELLEIVDFVEAVAIHRVAMDSNLPAGLPVPQRVRRNSQELRSVLDRHVFIQFRHGLTSVIDSRSKWV